MKGREKINGFFADKIVDPVVVKFTETVNNFGMYAGFLVNFAQRRLLFGLAIFDVTFRKPIWPEMLVMRMYLRSPSSSV